MSWSNWMVRKCQGIHRSPDQFEGIFAMTSTADLHRQIPWLRLSIIYIYTIIHIVCTCFRIVGYIPIFSIIFPLYLYDIFLLESQLCVAAQEQQCCSCERGVRSLSRTGEAVCFEALKKSSSVASDRMMISFCRVREANIEMDSPHVWLWQKIIAWSVAYLKIYR